MIQVVSTGEGLRAALRLLEETLRSGDALPESFVVRLQAAVDSGAMEVLAAVEQEDVVGVLVLSYRLGISAGSYFASIEELYVKPNARRLGVGRALLETAGSRFARRGVSYVEVQAVDESAEAFYSAGGYSREEEVRVMSRAYVL
ncbi:MAG: GNAT family N-acetyltransferase [Rubrobacteraceae bacterium]